MAVSQPDFIEVSNIYKRQYAYLNEKKKFIYFDFIESIVDGQYWITPVTGMMLPKTRTLIIGNVPVWIAFFLTADVETAQFW